MQFAVAALPETPLAVRAENALRRQILEEASSTVDASSRQTSPGLVPQSGRGSRKRTAKPYAANVPAKRQQRCNPGVVSPWTRQVD